MAGGDGCDPGKAGCECLDGACFDPLVCESNVCVPPDVADGNDEVATDEGDSTGEDGSTDDPTRDTTGDPCSGTEVLLYGQNSGPDDFGVTAGSYGGGFDIHVADDFTVPAEDSCWCITRVEARGYFFDPGDGVVVPAPYIDPTPEVQVEIYADAGNMPAVDSSWSSSGEADAFIDGDYAFTIPQGIVVPTGKYWFSLQPILEGFRDPSWRWALESGSTSGSVPYIRDLATYSVEFCMTWTPLDDCSGISAPDGYAYSMQFSLHGVVGGSDCD